MHSQYKNAVNFNTDVIQTKVLKKGTFWIPLFYNILQELSPLKNTRTQTCILLKSYLHHHERNYWVFCSTGRWFYPIFINAGTGNWPNSPKITVWKWPLRKEVHIINFHKTEQFIFSLVLEHFYGFFKNEK